MLKIKQESKIDGIFVLMIFCVFAASVLVVLIFSARIYKNMTDLSREGYEDQTCLSYIWTKVRNEDEAGKIFIGDFQGIPALCLDDDYGGVAYRTSIYLYDGWIREMFSQADLDFEPEDGSRVIEAQLFNLEQLENGLIKVSTATGHLLVASRSQAGLPLPLKE